MNRPIPWLAALSLLAAHTALAQDPSGPRPAHATDRHIVVTYGESAPTLDCAPMHVCDIELQPGEIVQGKPYIGDPNRWKVWPAMSGSGSQQMTHLLIKPSEPGLDTNLMVPTDRHTYHLHLHSSPDHYVSSVSYFYPDEPTRATAGANGTAEDTDEISIAPASHLNFSYRIKIVTGNPSLKPVRVMDDGRHTYIAMNDEIPTKGAPVLLGASADGKEQVIPYRFKGNLFVTDGVYARVSLVSAPRLSIQRIELTRDSCHKRGWLGICWDRKE